MRSGTPVSPAWFAVAVRALVFLAQADEPCPSAIIADTMHAHAVFLRRVLAQLVRAGIVVAREGRDGGYRLGKPAENITLAEIYEAIKASGPIDLSLLEPDQCAGTLSIHAALIEVVAETEASIIKVLSCHTIASLIARAESLHQ